VHVGSPEDVKRYVRRVPPAAERLIAKAWPGPVTVLLPTGGELADRKLQRAGLHEVLCHEDRVGLRCPDTPVTRAILEAVEAPVVAPSANLAGKPSPRDADDVLASLDGRIDLLIDAGPTRHGRDSTIVRFDPDGWRVVRKGVYDERAVRRFVRQKILFVCTGNTCRSPIAAGLARKLLAERLGCDAADLHKADVEVLSAGAFASGGGKASPEAVIAAKRFGADISRHRSGRLTAELIQDADVIFCMTDSHVAEVRRLVLSAAAKTRRLEESGNIADPIGGGPDVYRTVADRIHRALRARMKEGLL
jgi:protein-tyrosine phosphatase